MEAFVITGYAAVAVALFTIFRIPLNRWTVPVTALGGVFFVFTLIQVLNHYHPHSALSAAAPIEVEPQANIGAPQLVAWFRPNQQDRLRTGGDAEVTFAGIPGEVFSAEVRGVLRPADLGSATDENDLSTRVPVLVAVTDERYRLYRSALPAGTAQAAVYGEDMRELAVVRQTLLRMAAWMNYLTLPG